MKYWLIKSEPAVFGIDDLAARKRQTEQWEGVRNYQARNFMRDEMKKGDLAFFYHSSCAEPGIVGIVEVAREAHPDVTAFDPDSAYYDPKSDPRNPRWFMVDVKLKRKFARVVALKELRAHEALSDMYILQRGNRLSITPVTRRQWNYILKLEGR